MQTNYPWERMLSFDLNINHNWIEITFVWTLRSLSLNCWRKSRSVKVSIGRIHSNVILNLNRSSSSANSNVHWLSVNLDVRGCGELVDFTFDSIRKVSNATVSQCLHNEWTCYSNSIWALETCLNWKERENSSHYEND